MANHLAKFIPDLRFAHPCSLLVSGTTGAGKSHFVKLLIENDGIKGNIDTIYYFMPRLENLDIKPNENQNLYICEGMPTQSWVDNTFKKDSESVNLIVVDDMWSQCIQSPVIEYLLTYGRRHLNVSMVFIAQNFYEKSPKAITLR